MERDAVVPEGHTRDWEKEPTKLEIGKNEVGRATNEETEEVTYLWWPKSTAP